MTTEEAIVVVAAEDAIVAREAEEAIKDKDKSSHRLIGGINKDEGSDSVSSGGSDEISATAPARFRQVSSDGSGEGSAAAQTRWW